MGSSVHGEVLVLNCAEIKEIPNTEGFSCKSEEFVSALTFYRLLL